MAKPKKQHQQASKKKLQVKQTQKQAKVVPANAAAAGRSQCTEELPDSSKQAAASAATQQPKPAEAAGSEHTIVYGLNNLGNTCYYNSALQALVSVPAVRDFHTQPQKAPQLPKGPIGAALQEVVQTVYGHREAEHAHNAKAAKQSRREGSPLFCPSRLRAAIVKIAPQFKEQNEDAAVPQGFTDELFKGELSSRVVCKECSHETVSLEAFYDLSLPIPASLPATTEADGRSKPKGKGPKNKGKAAIEKSDESPAAQEQQKTTAKQRKKAERDARRQAQMERKKERKRASDAQQEELLSDSNPPGLEEQAPASTASPAASPSAAQTSSSDSSKSDATHAPAGIAAQQEPAGSEQKLCGGVVQGSSARGFGSAVDGPDGAAELPAASSRRSAQSAAPRDATHSSERSETSTVVHLDSDAPRQGGANSELASSVDSLSHGSSSLSLPEEVPTNTSDTYTSRNAESISMLAAEQTGFQASGLAGTAGSGGAEEGSGEGLCPQEPGQASPGRMKKLSEKLRSASLAPDARSGNVPAQRTAPGALDSSVEATENTLADAVPAPRALDRADSTRSGEKPLLTAAGASAGEEQIAETNPCSTELSGGAAADKATATEAATSQKCVRVGATTVVDILWEPSAAFRATGEACDFAHDAPEAGSTASLIAVPALSPAPEQKPHLSGSGLQPEASPGAATPASAQQPGSGSKEEDRGSRMDGESGAAEQLTISVPAGEGAADMEEQLGVALTSQEEAELYGDLDALQDDACNLGDVSDTEADVSTANREAETGGSGQVENEPAAGGEEMGALGSLFDEDASSTAPSNEITAESWEDSREQEHVSQEATIQGCLAAFFAREVITWECPAESAAASKQRKDELDGTPQLLKRRSVSFSEEKPRVKFIPGSAEQRGTNFVRALQGDRPFCRPLKHKGGSFLLNAYGQDENDATQLPLRDVHAINNRIEFGSVPISPVEDPEDEEEQSRVRSQAQALLDCVADLVVHSGLQGAIDLLTEGAQLQRVPSGVGSLGSTGSPRSGSESLIRMGSETWRVVGSLPPGFGEGAWEYPPPRDDSQGLSPSHRSPSTDVYVPADPADKAARPGAGAAARQLPASFWARFAASQEPIMEAAQEGSIDSDSQQSGELPLPLTPHNSVNEDASRAQSDGDGAGLASPSSQPLSNENGTGSGSGAAGRRLRRKPAPPPLETRNSFTITAEVPVSPFSNDPEGRLLSNGWEPSWPVQLPAGQRDSSEAYCRIFCSDRKSRNARPLSLRSDSADAASDSPFSCQASGEGYIADSDEDAESGPNRGANSRASSSTSLGGSSPFPSSSPFAGSGSGIGGIPERRHSDRSPLGGSSDDADSPGNSFSRQHSDRAPFTDPEPGDEPAGFGLFARRDSQMGFPGLDEELLNGDAPELPSASPGLSSPFSGRSADPSPFAAADVQLKGSSSGEVSSVHSSTSPLVGNEHGSLNADVIGQNGAGAQPTAARRAVPNGVHRNGTDVAANGVSVRRSASGRGSADSSNTPPTGVNKSTGNAVFWTGSKSLGISFVDDPAEDAIESTPARFTNGDMRLLGGAETCFPPAEDPASENGTPESAAGEAEHGANGPLVHQQRRETPAPDALEGDAARPAASAAAPGTGTEHCGVSAEKPTGKTANSAAADAPSQGHAEGVGGDSHLSGAAGDDDEADLCGGRKAQSLPSPQRRPSVGGSSLQRSVSKSILRKTAAVSVTREAVKGYLIHRAPEVLTLHLKRFQQDMRGRLAKIKGSVPFPADLDITPFCDPKGVDAAGAQYTLVGVVEQQGSMVSGHYWAYVARAPPGDPPPPPPLPEGSPAQSPRQQPLQQQSTQRQDSFDSEEAVPLAPAHKAGSSAKSGSQKSSAADSPSPAAANIADDRAEGARRRAAARQPPPSRLAGSRPKLDSSVLQWFHASDEKVKRVPWDTVAACEAYLLLYVRVR